MGLLLGKIVLTGGPCAGKTTALARIEEQLTEAGYRVLVVSESATELIKGGIKPFGTSPIDLIKFQELILKYQMNKEQLYEDAVASLPEGEKCVIIYDRGVLDNKAYIGQHMFNKLLNSLNLSELLLMDNYDMVIHLVTAADGKEEYYTLDNNTARTEMVEEAKKLDRKTVNAWVGHNNLKIIDNSTNFEEKLNRVLDCVHNILGNPISIRKQRKFSIDLNKTDLSFINEEESTVIEIEQTYLQSTSKSDDYERRLRKRTYNGQDTYYFTVQKKEKDGLSKIITDKKITEKEYFKIISMYDIKESLKKTRYAFVKDKQYFKLDIFDDDYDFGILEVDPTKENLNVIVPDDLYVIEDVTNDINYQNNVIANHKNKNGKKMVMQ
jgi:thymidylate kinase